MTPEALAETYDFWKRQEETPPRGWRRAEDTLNGGVNKETPSQVRRRAGHAIPGGVKVLNITSYPKLFKALCCTCLACWATQ